MINLLEEHKPQRICELGSGQSTDIFNVYAKKENATAYSIEHDIYWNTHKSIMMPLIENTKLMIGNHTYDKCNVYKGLEDWLDGQDKFDFILVDAPNDGIPSNNMDLEYARIQMVDFVILDKLSKESIVLYHDSERDIAQNTLNEFEHLLGTYNYEFQKEIVIEKDNEIIEFKFRKLNLQVVKE